jgi:hypothetical protein
MKTKILFSFLLLSVILGCTSSQKVTSSYLNKEAIPADPYKKLFVAVLAKDMEMKKAVENSFRSLLVKNGSEVVVSHDLFAPNFEAYSNISREEMLKKIIDAGCDGILTFTLLDVLEKERYEPGVVYGSGLPYGFYGSFYGYYSHRFPSVYSPGYYTTDKTYLFETNFYDVKNEALVWSVQSKAYSPASYNKWFNGYIKMLRQQMIIDGLIPEKANS